jgi:glycine/serine hydroxymethyltransferase
MPAMTTRGVKTAETKIIADFIDRALNNQKDEKYLVALKKEVATLCKQYPIPS